MLPNQCLFNECKGSPNAFGVCNQLQCPCFSYRLLAFTYALSHLATTKQNHGEHLCLAMRFLIINKRVAFKPLVWHKPLLYKIQCVYIWILPKKEKCLTIVASRCAAHKFLIWVLWTRLVHYGSDHFKFMVALLTDQSLVEMMKPHLTTHVDASD